MPLRFLGISLAIESPTSKESQKLDEIISLTSRAQTKLNYRNDERGVGGGGKGNQILIIRISVSVNTLLLMYPTNLQRKNIIFSMEGQADSNSKPCGCNNEHLPTESCQCSIFKSPICNILVNTRHDSTGQFYVPWSRDAENSGNQC